MWLTGSLILCWKDLSSDLAKSSRRKIQLLAKTLILWWIYIQWTNTVHIQSAPLEINYWYGNREINIQTTFFLFFNVCQAALRGSRHLKMTKLVGANTKLWHLKLCLSETEKRRKPVQSFSDWKNTVEKIQTNATSICFSPSNLRNNLKTHCGEK